MFRVPQLLAMFRLLQRQRLVFESDCNYSPSSTRMLLYRKLLVNQKQRLSVNEYPKSTCLHSHSISRQSKRVPHSHHSLDSLTSLHNARYIKQVLNYLSFHHRLIHISEYQEYLSQIQLYKLLSQHHLQCYVLVQSIFLAMDIHIQ